MKQELFLRYADELVYRGGLKRGPKVSGIMMKIIFAFSCLLHFIHLVFTSILGLKSQAEFPLDLWQFKACLATVLLFLELLQVTHNLSQVTHAVGRNSGLEVVQVLCQVLHLVLAEVRHQRIGWATTVDEQICQA